MENYKKFTKKEALQFLEIKLGNGSEWQQAHNYGILCRIIRSTKETYLRSELLDMIDESDKAI